MIIRKLAAAVIVGVLFFLPVARAGEFRLKDLDPVPTGGTQKPKKTDSKDALQGVWINESIEMNGDSVDQETVNLRMVFKGDKLFVSERSSENEGYGYRIDATKSPMHIDFTAPGEKGFIPGIFAVKGNTLTICVRLIGERPTEFTSASGQVLLEFKKQKK